MMMIRKAPPGWATVAGGMPDDDGFAAQYYSGEGVMVTLVASWGGSWEHVSVSRPDRCPAWNEMEAIARHFWPNDTAMMLHVPRADHINNYPYCLHWWRPTGDRIPRPPKEFV